MHSVGKGGFAKKGLFILVGCLHSSDRNEINLFLTLHRIVWSRELRVLLDLLCSLALYPIVPLT